MSNKELTIQEAEAVLMLKGSNEAAFDTLIAYFDRRYNMARDKCVDTRVEFVQIEQGIAKAFKQIKNLEKNADEVNKTQKQK